MKKCQPSSNSSVHAIYSDEKSAWADMGKGARNACAACANFSQLCNFFVFHANF